MKGWTNSCLGEQVRFLSGGTPNKNIPKYWGGDIPWVTSGEMNQRRILSTQYALTEDGVLEASPMMPTGTIFTVVRGMSLAHEFRVSIAMRPMTFNQDVKAIVAGDKIDSAFLFYYLLSQNTAIKDSASEAAHGTKKIDMAVLEQWPFLCPPLPVQRKIAAVLSAYDDLIENNKRRIAILEKMAEELYREWFVRLRFPGHEKVKIVKGVPEGWEVRKSFDVLDILGGGTPKTDVPSFWDGEIAFFTPKDSYQGIFTTETEKQITEQGLQSCNSALFPKNTIFITARGTVGNIVLAGEPMAMNQSCYALIPKSKSHVYFHFLALRNSVSVIKGTSNSGVFDNIITDSFKQFGYLLPHTPILDQFTTLITPLFQRIALQIQSNSTLSTTRDRLLSRLMSGNIDVEELDIAFPKSMAEEGA